MSDTAKTDSMHNSKPAITSEDEAKALAANAAEHGKLKPALESAGLGLVCGALLVIVIAGYVFGVSYAGYNSDAIAGAWSVILSGVALLSGILVAIALPIVWSRGKGMYRTLEIIAFEALFLIIALAISGYFLFNGQSGSSNTGPGNCCYQAE